MTGATTGPNLGHSPSMIYDSINALKVDTAAVSTASATVENNISTSEKVINHILRLNLNELLELAEGVGDYGEYEAFSESP